MYHKILFFVFLLAGNISFSQTPHWTTEFGDSKDVTRYKLEDYLKQFNYPGKFSYSDSSLGLHVKVSHLYTVDFTYYFDKENKMIRYKYSNCDTCVKTYLKNRLANKRFKWKKINNNSYLSKYSIGELMEIDDILGNFTFSVRRLRMPKKEYNKLYSAMGQ